MGNNYTRGAVFSSKISLSYIHEILVFYSLFILIVVSTYFLPHLVSIMLQLLLLGFYFFSKKDYFWLALIFVVESQIGGLSVPLRIGMDFLADFHPSVS